VELRATTVEDLPALHQIFLAATAGLYSPHGFEPPTPPLESFATQQRHILATGGRAVLVEDGSEIVGFGSSWSRGADWFLASLFVSPTAQGAGLGQRLLDAVWCSHSLRRRTLTDAIQPVSNAVYGVRGLIPATPVLAFSGQASSAEPSLAATSATSPQLGAIDAAAYGFDRAVDHAYWQTLARLTTWRHGGETVAYSYVWPDGAIGPVAGLNPEAAAAALEGELARATGPVTVRIPGSSRALVAVAFRRGLRLSPTPGFLLLSDGVQPPESLAIGSYSLY
jgi:GNAT superfamily N-acetyltransferase